MKTENNLQLSTPSDVDPLVNKLKDCYNLLKEIHDQSQSLSLRYKIAQVLNQFG